MKVKLFLKFRKNDEKNEQSLEKVISDMLKRLVVEGKGVIVGRFSC